MEGCTAWTFSADQWGDVRCYYKSSKSGRHYSSGMVSGYLPNDYRPKSHAKKEHAKKDSNASKLRGAAKSAKGKTA